MRMTLEKMEMVRRHVGLAWQESQRFAGAPRVGTVTHDNLQHAFLQGVTTALNAVGAEAAIDPRWTQCLILGDDLNTCFDQS